MNVNTIKGIITSILGLLSAILGVLYIPVLLLVSCNIIDYVTGLMAAKYREGGYISSYKSIKGIQKKVSMWILVVVGAIIDQLIIYTTDIFGFQFPLRFLVACIVAIWLVCNELISIIENLKDIGVNIPKFLMPLIKNIKSNAENAATIEDNEEIENDEEITGE